MPELPVEVSGRALIIDQKGRVLVLKRSENSGSNPGKWELPGGKPNKGESFEESFRREVLEETGFSITIHQSAGTADQLVSGYHVIHVVMVASIESGGLSISDEHSAYQWAEMNSLGALDKADWFSRYFQSLSLWPGPETRSITRIYGQQYTGFNTGYRIGRDFVHSSVVITRENRICWVTRIARWRSASLIVPAVLVTDRVPVASERKFTEYP